MAFVDIVVTLFMLVLLQAVLGFDNLLYISLESRRAPEKDQARVRKLGIGLAVGLRIVLLFVLIKLVRAFENPFWTFGFDEDHKAHGIVSGDVSVASLIVLAGGGFILYTAVKEIFHMLVLHDPSHDVEDRKPSSAKKVIGMIVAMNLVFSFDSILSAMALTDNFWIMATAIIIGGALMIWLADRVSEFIKKNRMYEVLGLFILFIVGILLISEGGHKAHLHFFSYAVEPMTKTTFYFVIAILVATDIVQSRYRKKLLAAAESQSSKH
ncbi:MAG: TerC family protein [Verrucomicrobiota bacterium]